MRYDCLIIDDEQELANNTCEYFNMFDVKTHAVYSSAEANAFLNTNETSLVLLDINLSDGSGFELCKKIRQTLNIPILFISARNTDDDKIIALNIGGDDYIEKPYSLGVLLAKVKVVLKRFASVSETEDPKSSDFDDGYLKTDSVNKTVYVTVAKRRSHLSSGNFSNISSQIRTGLSPKSRFSTMYGTTDLPLTEHLMFISERSGKQSRRMRRTQSISLLYGRKATSS